jgi:hypothetical protein
VIFVPEIPDGCTLQYRDEEENKPSNDGGEHHTIYDAAIMCLDSDTKKEKAYGDLCEDHAHAISWVAKVPILHVIS